MQGPFDQEQRIIIDAICKLIEDWEGAVVDEVIKENMDSTTKDELKIKSDKEIQRLQITNYDQMLKEFIEFVDECCDDALEFIESGNSVYAAYSIGRLHKTASDAIDNFGIGHLFKKEIEDKE